MHCPDCQTINADTYRYCSECGQALVLPAAAAPQGLGDAAAPAAPPARIQSSAGRGLMPLVAIAAGAVIIVASAMGMRASRGHRPAQHQRITRASPPFTAAPALQWPAPAPAPSTTSAKT